jgi:hypothetical protein
MIQRAEVIGCVSSIIALVFALPAGADIISFQDGVNGYAGTSDNQMYSSAGIDYKNNGAAPSFQIGVTSNGVSERRVILRFDVSSLAGKYESIQSARLELTGTGTDFSDVVISLYQIADANAGWNEGTGNFSNALPGESTWRFKAEGPVGTRIPWAGDWGLSVEGTDYLAPALDSVTFNKSDVNGMIYTFDLTPELIEHWVTGTNAGLLLIRNDLSYDGVAQFWSSEYTGNLSYRPRLVIEYTSVPEPVSASLLLATGAAVGFRRRRS